MSDPADTSSIEEYPLDDGTPTGLSPRRLLNASTALALAVVLLLLAATNYQRFFPPPPFSGQNIYLDLGNQIEALDAQTGYLRWKVTQAHRFLAVSEGLLIGVQDLHGITVYAWSATDGALRWQTTISDLPDCVAAQLLTLHGVVAITCAVSSAISLPAVSATVVALDAATGAIIWHYTSNQATSLLLASAGADLLVGETNSSYQPNMWLYAFDVRSGVAQWRMRVSNNVDEITYDATSNIVVVRSGETLYGTSVTSDGTVFWQRTFDQAPPPLVGPGVAYVVTFGPSNPNGTLTLALDLRTGATQWQMATPFPITNGAATTPQGYVYTGDPDAAIVLLDARTGTPRWHAARGLSLSIMGVAANLIFCQSDAALVVLNAADGTQRWHLALPQDPLLARTITFTPRGNLVIVAEHQDVYAIATQTGAIRWHVTLPQSLDSAPLVGG